VSARIRHARPADHPAIAAVTKAAFPPKGAEAELIARLRAGGDVLFELVAVEGEDVQGHILFSRLWADRAELFAALSPVSVRPDLQRCGLGSQLIRTGLETAKEFGAHGVLVLGHPEYYPRFGFSAALAGQVQAPYAGSPAFMALALEAGAFDQPLSVAYPDAFSA
jgi:putative acetyltransferase